MSPDTNSQSPVNSNPAVAEYARRMELYRRNEKWMQQHGAPLREKLREEFPSQFFAVSQGEVFVAEDEDKAARLAKEKHPDDEPYVELIPHEPSPFIITVEPGDPKLIRRRELIRRNSEWISKYGAEFWDQHRGRHIAISEGEVFVADDAWEAERLAKEKHPDDEPFVQYIPKEKYSRIYAYRGTLA